MGYLLDATSDFLLGYLWVLYSDKMLDIGPDDGLLVGLLVCPPVGLLLGFKVGLEEDVLIGPPVGLLVRILVGPDVGLELGDGVRGIDSVGAKLGDSLVGPDVGLDVELLDVSDVFHL